MLRVSYMGDSIVEQPLPTWPDFVPTYSAYLASAGSAVNYGVNGQRASQMVTDYPTSAHLNRPLSGDQGFFFLQGGGNDISDGVSAATVYGYLRELWTLARADTYTVCAVTVLPRGSWGSGSEAEWAALNTLILSDPTLYDVLVRADLVLANPLNTADYYDTTHPTVLGANRLAQAAAADVPVPVVRPMVASGMNQFLTTIWMA